MHIGNRDRDGEAPNRVFILWGVVLSTSLWVTGESVFLGGKEETPEWSCRF